MHLITPGVFLAVLCISRARTAHLNATTPSLRTSESRTRTVLVITPSDARPSTTSTPSDTTPSIQQSMGAATPARTLSSLEDSCRVVYFSYDTSCEPLQAVFLGSPTPTRTPLMSANHTWAFTSATSASLETRLFDPSFVWARALPCFDYVCHGSDHTETNVTIPHELQMPEPAWARCGSFWNMINNPPRSKPVALEPAETIVVPTFIDWTGRLVSHSNKSRPSLAPDNQSANFVLSKKFKHTKCLPRVENIGLADSGDNRKRNARVIWLLSRSRCWYPFTWLFRSSLP